jgi:hypothetical protein
VLEALKRQISPSFAVKVTVEIFYTLNNPIASGCSAHLAALL